MALEMNVLKKKKTRLTIPEMREEKKKQPAAILAESF